VTGEEFTVWDPNRFPYYDASCTGGFNESACGPYYSELKNLAFCPTTNPERWPVLVQTPVPLYRPTASVLNAASSGGVQNVPLVDSVGDGSGEAYRDGDGTGSTFPVLRPAPFLYTGNDQAIASELAGGMLFNVSAAEQLDELITSLPAFLANTTIDFTRFNELFTASPFQGGGAFLLGSAAQQQQGSLQTDSAWGSRPILMYLTSDCSLLTPAESAVLTAIGTGSDGLLTTPCVSVPAFGVANAGLMNGLLFSGYGRGAVGSVGSRTNISSYPFAVDFGSSDPASATLKASLLYNGTVIGGTGQPLNVFYRSSGALNRLANSFLAALDGGGGSPRAAMRYMRDMPSQGFGLYIDIGEFLGPLFYTWLAQLLFPVMVGLLVYEKEKNLRTMMRVQGLGDAAYMLVRFTRSLHCSAALTPGWALASQVNYIYYFLLYLAYLLLMYVYGLMLGYGTNSLSLWTRSQPGPVILFFILFINVQIGIAFFFQAVFSNAKTATIFSIVFLLVTGLLGNFLFQPFLEADSFPRGGIVGMELIIPFALYRGFYEMSAFGGVAATYPRGQGEQSVGISWAKIAWSADVPGGMSRVMLIFFIESLFIHALAFWLDQVYSSGSGVKRHPLFFLDGLLKEQVQARLDAAARAADLPAEASSDDGPDVCACRDNAYSTVPTHTAILARGLAKTYPSLDGAPPKVACRDLSVAIPAGECFGLLVRLVAQRLAAPHRFLPQGPNGAGKSTAINLLIGFLTPTRGTAYVQGFNVREELDLVYSQLGVCPQHDLLWEQLSARDHLIFYGRLKNLRGAALREACDEALRSVNLLAGGVGERPCGTYSGGMKRRLSVAISLIGDPPVVFLDEVSAPCANASAQRT